MQERVLRAGKGQALRKIVFIGNCQAGALADVYRSCIAPCTEDFVSQIFAYGEEQIDTAARALLDAADVIVGQVFDYEQVPDPENIGPHVLLIRFPWVAAHFLWPSYNEAHPRNQAYWYLPSGPWPAQLGDSFLNRMIAEGVGAAEAAERYLRLDIASAARLERRYELIMDAQRLRDERSGTETADFIERHFRDEPLFVSPDHPGLSLFLHLARQVYAKLGATAADLARVETMVRKTPFPADELPIHPGVARHFGLRFWREDTRYRHLRSGRFTAEEYYRRYMVYEWDEMIHEGLALLDAGRKAEGYDMLGKGLGRAPHHVLGLARFGHLLIERGQLVEAEAVAWRAAAIDASEPDSHAALGHLFAALKRHQEAAAAFRKALALEAGDASVWMALSFVLDRLDRTEEAFAAAREAIRLNPFEPGWGEHVERLGRRIGSPGLAPAV